MADAMDKDLRSKTAALPKSNADERAAAQEQLASEGNVLEKLRQTKATGRIVLEIDPADSEISALPALRLEDGDRLIIPPRPATVEVVGAVYNQNSFIYKDRKDGARMPAAVGRRDPRRRCPAAVRGASRWHGRSVNRCIVGYGKATSSPCR